ncbi:hypothetical protein [Paraburkholderia sp. DHOC27]|uniref:hypothetical protein n=1 Tax=Paraburkholderia sp. DHOC27 TaxID=2303330 RepID=UPI0011C11C63|nr:hypothetical protein [Paraburkholderia sp. DHOC27]
MQTRNLFIARFALRRPALRNVIDRVKSERAGSANSQAVNSVVQARRELRLYGSRAMKERYRPESESDRTEPFLCASVVHEEPGREKNGDCAIGFRAELNTLEALP